MMRIRTAAAPSPLLTEAIELRRVDLDDQPFVATLGHLSRGLSVLALGGCAVLALAVVHSAGKPAREIAATQPRAASVQPAALAQAAPTAAQDVRLVYGNPDELRGANRQTDAAARTAAVPADPVPQLAAPVTAHVASAEPAAPAPLDAAPAGSATSVGPVSATPDGVDLNTASVEQLNGLNAGMIGRTIVRGRPYGSPDELVQRRILNRADFARIKDRVVVGSAER